MKCYDKVEQHEAAVATTDSIPASSLMGTRWELDPSTRHDLFSIRPHKQSYLLPARYTSNVNNQPFSPTQGTVPQSLGYINTEVKFQFSFKFKALEIKIASIYGWGIRKSHSFRCITSLSQLHFVKIIMSLKSWA